MSSVRGVWSLLAAVLLVGAGCEGGPGNEKHPTDDTPPPEGYAGVFHWENKPDAYNLSIEPGGVVRWSMRGCDTMGDARGHWEARDGKLVLSGLRGNDTTTVELAPDFDGLISTGPVRSSDGSPTQRWPRGGVCPVCKNPDGGPVLGPIEVQPCDNPSLP
ncbi:hypothetical protein [Archangium lansingense]|uniref:Lipoprotein n=1 Tax=Archangium lansingense TaxID=2995310 RepID=A0ABT3ZW67_9BACT|nr:hypothetical protein [Archangium lansinium]MCY1073640.1 hypothetical protein [Archangium lansinium]